MPDRRLHACSESRAAIGLVVGKRIDRPYRDVGERNTAQEKQDAYFERFPEQVGAMKVVDCFRLQRNRVERSAA